MGPSRREWLGRLGLAGGGALAALLLCEALVRALGLAELEPRWERISSATRHTRAGSVALVLYPSNPRGYFKLDLREQAVLKRYAALGVSGLEHAALTPFAVEHRYNSLGWRDREFPAKRPGVTRIVVLGDSFTEGFGVEQQDAYPQVLGRLLDEVEPGRFEVFNCGRSDTDFPYLFTTVFKNVEKLDPDVVIYGLVLNDALQSPILRTRHPEPLELTRRPRVGLGLFDSRLLAFARLARERERLSRATTAWYLALYSQANEPAWNRTQALIERMHRSMRARGGRFLLAVWPLLVDLQGRYPFAPAHAALQAFAQREGLAFHDLLGALQGRDSVALQVHPVDAHPNELAQRLAAQSLLPVVRELAGLPLSER